MNNLAPYELVMVSGVSPENNVSYGFFATREQAELVGGFLMDADAQNHPEWSSYTVTHHAELEAVVRDARRLDWLESMANKPGGLLLHDGSESGRCGLGLRPGAADRDLRTAIDQAMHNSAREG